MFVFFLRWGYLAFRPLYIIPIYLNFASWVAPQVWYIEPWYVYAVTLDMLLVCTFLPVVGPLFALASAWSIWGWYGVAFVTPLAAIECYRWYLWNRVDEAVTNGHLN